MKTSDMLAALHQTLKAALPNVLWGQPLQDKPTVSPWSAITCNGVSSRSAFDPRRHYVYFQIWIYMDTEDEAELLNYAENTVAVFDDKLIQGTGTGKVRFNCTSISPVFWADEYQQKGITITLRTLTTSI